MDLFCHNVLKSVSRNEIPYYSFKNIKKKEKKWLFKMVPQCHLCFSLFGNEKLVFNQTYFKGSS